MFSLRSSTSAATSPLGRDRSRRRRLLGSCAALTAVAAMLAASSAQAKLAGEIHDTLALEHAGAITNVRFAPNGEVFAIDKAGQIFDYPSLAEPNNETILADISSEVMNYEDRGLLGLAIDPQYPVRPYIYVLYTYDAPPGQIAPVWPNEGCSTPPGPGPEFGEGGGDGCVVTGRVSRITVNLSTHKMVGEEQPLIKDDWCQQFTSHSIGDLQFGPEGALYVSGGAGGAFNTADWGQWGGTLPNTEHPVTPKNPCGDPNETSGAGSGVAGVTKEEIPTAEGGVLRSQSFRRPANQPATLGGTMARVNPENGEPLADNPNIAASDINRKRIVAYGLRNPFRFTFRPGTKELWIGDVGENTWEEIDRDTNPLGISSANFGWPCFEGKDLPFEYGVEYEGINLCKKLYPGGGSEENTAEPPYYAYRHNEAVTAGDECPYRFEPPEPATETGSSTTGLAFLNGGPWPSAWNGALFFGDLTRDCIWAMMPEVPGGLPKPQAASIKWIESLSEGKGAVCEFTAAPSGCPVDLELGPEGDIYYTDIDSGTIHRLSYEGYPVAVLGTSGPMTHADAPFTFTGSTSTSPDPEATTYHWDFGDGSGASTANATHTYAAAGKYTATLTVTDATAGTHDSSSVNVTVLEPEPPAKKEEPPIEKTTHVETPPASAVTPAITSAMTLTGVALTPTAFRAAPTATLRKATGKGRSAVGATLRLVLSKAATVKLSVARRVGGRYKSVAARGAVVVCTLGPPRGPAHRRARKCRSPRSDRLSLAGIAGANRFTLSGWVGGMALPAGSYQLTAQAFAPDMTVSVRASVRFTIAAPPRHR
jgi:glucose/arabinose dehydrogenase